MIILKQECFKRGWSGAELARRSDMNPTTISQIMTKKLSPYPVQVSKIVSAIEWEGDPSELFKDAKDE